MIVELDKQLAQEALESVKKFIDVYYDNVLSNKYTLRLYVNEYYNNYFVHFRITRFIHGGLDKVTMCELQSTYEYITVKKRLKKAKQVQKWTGHRLVFCYYDTTLSITITEKQKDELIDMVIQNNRKYKLDKVYDELKNFIDAVNEVQQKQ